MLNLQLVSKQIKENVQLTLKSLLASIGFNNPNTTTPQNIIFRTLYGRDTYFWSFDQSVKPFKRRHILEMPVKSMQIGLTYTGILTIQNRLYICQSHEYQDLINQKPNFIIQQFIQMLIIQDYKQRKIYIPKRDSDLIITFENLEEYLIAQNVEFFETSYFQLTAIFSIPQKIPQLHSDQTRAILYQLQDLTTQNCDQAQKYKQIILPEDENIIQVAMGSNAIYYLSKTQKIYQSDTKNEQVSDPNIRTVHQNYFDRKSIISIYSGLNYFLALGRENIKSIKEWTNEELQAWLSKIQLIQVDQKDTQQQQPQQQNDEGGKKRKKSRQDQKDIKDQKEYKDQEQQLQQQQSKYWSDFSKIFIKSNYKREYKYYYVNLGKDYLIVICSILDKKTIQNYFPEILEQKEMQKKFKPTLQFIDRILWDVKYNKDDFVVGCEDRFLGIMEVPLSDYTNSQVKKPQSSIFQIKWKNCVGQISQT
ncbi:unnamed protein product (macronuclear) [Paramecium tetraurelia]|uniref:MJ1316 RNA cyclic group end recognition domain-containing protein n=1 Tax=Paramecium tetraurelia TaxID=5888 RepID=A0DM13_PARTE|nr:uncharacterized protein GSPATT00018298001 [Paramecium tetraurelia]CAK84080.1 unnamed protein product [Paramecium tetraurelia]|eukprot:XP_001451477.1 hypothetical protein (macronuclear) [Paramecium tetraurelia strain d4-2]